MTHLRAATLVALLLVAPFASAADHYGGAKDEETIIQVRGMGPATSTPVGPR